MVGFVRNLKHAKFQILVHVGAWIPLIWLVSDFIGGNLTANPIQDITLRTGKTTLILLVLTLSATPLHSLFGSRWMLKARRKLGLYTFLYASIHFLVFVGLDYGFDWGLLKEAIFEKPYALVGFGVYLIMIPLAITSTKGWMRRLGKYWKKLHRFVYLAALLAVLHYTLSVKADIREPLIYGGVILLLLALRISALRVPWSNFRRRASGEIRRRKRNIFST